MYIGKHIVFKLTCTCTRIGACKVPHSQAATIRRATCTSATGTEKEGQTAVCSRQPSMLKFDHSTLDCPGFSRFIAIPMDSQLMDANSIPPQPGYVSAPSS